MNTGKIEVIYGDGQGKTAFALGRGMQALVKHREVIVIEFLKGGLRPDVIEVNKRLEPEMKVFRFERSGCYFSDLSEEEKKEEQINIRNGLNYAKKVLTTGECDVLILDEILGVIDQNIIPAEEIVRLLECRDEADVILTGRVIHKDLLEIADRVDRIDPVKLND